MYEEEGALEALVHQGPTILWRSSADGVAASIWPPGSLVMIRFPFLPIACGMSRHAKCPLWPDSCSDLRNEPFITIDLWCARLSSCIISIQRDTGRITICTDNQMFRLPLFSDNTEREPCQVRGSLTVTLSTQYDQHSVLSVSDPHPAIHVASNLTAGGFPVQPQTRAENESHVSRYRRM